MSIGDKISVLRWLYGALFALLIGLVCYVGGWLAYEVRWHINVTAIDVPPTVEGDHPTVDVARTLTGNWSGGYRVQIRSQPDNYRICDTGDVDVIYKENGPDGQRTTLPDPMPLRYWAYGGTCTDILHASEPPLSAGLYSMQTCHYVYFPWGLWPRKTQCWPYTLFRIYETESAFQSRNPVDSGN